MAIEIQQELESGVQCTLETNTVIEDLVAAYFQAIKAKGVAPKTESKYRADLEKLRNYCNTTNIALARRFSEDDLYRYRQ